MKLKVLLTGLLISLLSISYSFAINELNLAGMGQNIGGDTTNFCVVKSDLSFDCSETDNVLVSYTNGGNANMGSSFWWRNDGLGFYYSNNLVNIQGVITGFTFCPGNYISSDSFGEYWNGCTDTLTYGEFKQYSSSHQLKKWGWATFYNYRGNGGPVFVFDEGAFRLSFGVGSESNNLYYGTYGLQNFGLSGNPMNADYSKVGLITSPFGDNVTYYYSTGSCPSVGQIKRSSGLTPAVCYGGYPADLIYTAGEDTPIQGGSGLNLFEVYEIFSGNMNIQNWYDTYWNYYNNISFNPYPFYNKPKALLGLMFARQTAGLVNGYKGTYSIFNYCWYLLNDFPDNANTCVVPSVQSRYPGITITDQDRNDINDSVNDDYNVHTPTSGSKFDDPSGGAGGGGSSWGDDKCESIPCLFDKFYQMFTSSRINDVDFSQGGQGILPQYIALAFVVVVLFYVFKR